MPMRFPEIKIIEQAEALVPHRVIMETQEHTVPITPLPPQGVAEPTIEAPEAINPEVQHRAGVTTVLLPVQVLEVTAVAVLPAVGLVAVTAVQEVVPEALV